MKYVGNKKARRILAMFALALLAVVAITSVACAASLPWESGFRKLTDSITGPVALAVSVCAIVACGAALIFGGDMQGFIRQALYLAGVVGIIVCATNLLSALYTKPSDASSAPLVDIQPAIHSPFKVIR